MTSWRTRAAPIIRQVLAVTQGKPEQEIRAALRAAYPFGERKYYPYDVWLDEIKRQRGTKPALRDPRASNPNQTELALTEGTCPSP